MLSLKTFLFSPFLLFPSIPLLYRLPFFFLSSASNFHFCLISTPFTALSVGVVPKASRIWMEGQSEWVIRDGDVPLLPFSTKVGGLPMRSIARVRALPRKG